MSDIALDGKHRIKLWDLPLRLFHWSLAAAFTTAFVTGKIGGNLIDLHATAGVTVVALLAFRLVWGFIGSPFARFREFLPTIGRIRAYLGGRWHGHGHNPLGALSVFALLGLLALQSGSGLFTNNDIDFTGPLYALIDEALSFRVTGFHKLLAYALLGMVGLHLAAIAYYGVVRKDNLVKPMVTGWKELTADKASPAPPVPATTPWMRLIIALSFSLLAAYVAEGGLLSQPAPAQISVEQSQRNTW